MGDLVDSLTGNLIDLGNTATLFGQGAIASSISGVQAYSQDPAAAAYATQANKAGAAATASSGASLLLFVVLLYVIFK